MKSVLRILGVSCLFATLVSGYTLQEGQELNPSEDSALVRDGILKKTERVEGWVMPHLYLYRIINAEAKEVAAVFSDVERHPDYFPDMLSVKIDTALSPSILRLNVKQHLFLWFKDRAQVENWFYQDERGYTLRWKILKSESAVKGEGIITFRPFHGKTLMQYASLVQPRSKLSRYKFVRNIAIDRLGDILARTEAAVLREKADDDGLLKSQIANMRYHPLDNARSANETE